MTGNSLRAWLQYLRIDKYHDQLARAGHDARSVAQLDDSALAALGLPLGPRKKIRLNAGLILQSCESSAATSGPSAARTPSQQQPADPAAAAGCLHTGQPPQQQQSGLGTAGSAGGQAAPLACELWMGALMAPRPAPPAPAVGGPRPQSGPIYGHGHPPPTHPPNQHQHLQQHLHQHGQQPQQCGHQRQGHVPIPAAAAGAQTAAPAAHARPQGHAQAQTSSWSQPHPHEQQPHQPQQQQQQQQQQQHHQQQQPTASCLPLTSSSMPGVVRPHSGGSSRSRPGPGSASQPGVQAGPAQPSDSWTSRPPSPNPTAPQAAAVAAAVAAPTWEVGASVRPGPRGDPLSRVHAPPPPSRSASPSTSAGRSAPASPPPQPAAAASANGFGRYGVTEAQRPASSGTAAATAASAGAEGAPSPPPPPSALVLAEQRALTELYSYPYRSSAGAHGRRQPGLHGRPGQGHVRGAIPPREAPRPARPPALLPAGRALPVLKRSRSWDGSCLVRTGAPAQSAVSGGAARPEPGASGQLPEGQDLYAAAASAGPVEVDFGPLKMEAAEAAVAARQRRQQVQEQRQQQEQAERLLHVVLEGVAGRAVAGGALQAPARQALASAGAGAGCSAASGAGRPRQAQATGAGTGATAAATPGAATAVAAAAAASSLLDDPRNFETPELLALLLQEDRAAAEAADAAAAAALAAAEEAEAASEQAGEAGGAAGAQPTREQRQARLRALREEVAATERLLDTLRAMVAEEERALGAETGGPGGQGGGRAGGAGSGVGAGAGRSAGVAAGGELLRVDAGRGWSGSTPAFDAGTEAQLWQEDAPTQVWGVGEDMLLTERLGLLAD